MNYSDFLTGIVFNRSRRELPGRQSGHGFTLVEMLVVLAIIAILTTLAIPSLQSLLGASNVNKAIGDFSRVLQEARAYAMANHTYVRVAIAQVSTTSGYQSTPTSLILILSSCDGTLSAGSSTPAVTDMANAAIWPTVEPPLILHNILIYNFINGSSPNTTNDSYPSQSSLGSFTYPIAGYFNPAFTSFIQINPAGEISIPQSLSASSGPARYIKIALDQPIAPSNTSTNQGKNPFILRVSGINGSIIVLREGQGI